MSGSKGLKRYNVVEQDDEGAYVYYDEHIAALRRAKADGVLVCERERDELSKDLEEVRKQLAGYKDQHRRDREYIERLRKELGHGKGEVVR